MPNRNFYCSSLGISRDFVLGVKRTGAHFDAYESRNTDVDVFEFRDTLEDPQLPTGILQRKTFKNAAISCCHFCNKSFNSNYSTAETLRCFNRSGAQLRFQHQACTAWLGSACLFTGSAIAALASARSQMTCRDVTYSDTVLYLTACQM